MSAKIFALANQKGGVGKTTVTWHFVDAARRRGLRVLAIDLDPQGSLSDLLAEDPLEVGDAGIADVLTKHLTLADVIVPGCWPGVDLAGTAEGSMALHTARDLLVVAGAGREARLRDAITAVRDNYDVIFIDCPPTLDQLTINGLAAADEVAMVTQTALLSVKGMIQLRNSIETIKSYYSPNLKNRGAIINMHEAQTIEGREQLAEIEEAMEIIGYPIPRTTVIKDSSSSKVGLEDWGTSRARMCAVIFRDIFAELHP